LGNNIVLRLVTNILLTSSYLETVEAILFHGESKNGIYL